MEIRPGNLSTEKSEMVRSLDERCRVPWRYDFNPALSGCLSRTFTEVKTGLVLDEDAVYTYRVLGRVDGTNEQDERRSRVVLVSGDGISRPLKQRENVNTQDKCSL